MVRYIPRTETETFSIEDGNQTFELQTAPDPRSEYTILSQARPGSSASINSVYLFEVLVEPRMIAGRITDSAGNAVEGATVKAVDVNNLDRVKRVDTLSDGTYQIDVPGGGEFHVTARHTDVNGNQFNALSKPFIQVESTIPDNEDFEHNDLIGVYAGDTGSFNIQTNTVESGTYALFGDGSQSHNLIVRDTTDKFERGSLRITWRQYIPSGGSGGIALATSATGQSSANYYSVFASDNSGSLNLRKWISGSLNTESVTNTSPTSGQWIDASVDVLSDSIDATVDGISASLTDSEFSSLLLGCKVFKSTYIDNVQFSSI